MGVFCYFIQMFYGLEVGRGFREDWQCVNKFRLDFEREYVYRKEGEVVDGFEERIGVRIGSWYFVFYCIGLG